MYINKFIHHRRRRSKRSLWIYARGKQSCLAYVSIRQHSRGANLSRSCLAYVSIRQHTQRQEDVPISLCTCSRRLPMHLCQRQAELPLHTSAYVSIR